MASTTTAKGLACKNNEQMKRRESESESEFQRCGEEKSASSRVCLRFLHNHQRSSSRPLVLPSLFFPVSLLLCCLLCSAATM